MFRKVLDSIILFFYIFTTNFTFLPGLIATRMLIGGWGVVTQAFNKRLPGKFVMDVIVYNSLFVFATLITFFFTGHFATWFVQHAALNIVYMFGGLYVAYLFTRYNISWYQFLYIIILIILLHNIIAFAGTFLFPAIGNFIVSIQKFSLGNEIMMRTLQWHTRAIGFGIGSFFLGGSISGLAMILSFYLMSTGFFTPRKGGLIVTLLLITGIFIARTSMIGLIGLVFLLKGKHSGRMLVKWVFSVVFVAALVVAIYLEFFSDLISIDWAFELVINYFDSGELETRSTDHLMTMWVFPKNELTWVIGDGLFLNKDGTYYMHTDVGYLRVIYGIGLVGLFVFVLNQAFYFRTLVKLGTNDSNLKLLAWILVAYILILNIKGLFELNYFYFLLIGFLQYRKYYERKWAENKRIVAGLQCRENAAADS